MARSARIWTRCPKCEKRWLRVAAGGLCGALRKKALWPGWPAPNSTCDGLVVAVTPNAPRSASGKRVRMSVNLQPETAKVLTATQAAMALDVMVASGWCEKCNEPRPCSGCTVKVFPYDSRLIVKDGGQ